MNTATLEEIKRILTQVKTAIQKAKLPQGYDETKRESQIMLTDVLISEVDREIASNRKRSERAKRCIAQKMIKINEATCHF